MKHEIADEKLTGILDKLTGELPAHVEERAMREMANAKPVCARSRRRLIALAVGAAVVLFGLGFVPVPARGDGSPNNVWQMTIAAVKQIVAPEAKDTAEAPVLVAVKQERATLIYFEGKAWQFDGVHNIKWWGSPGGFERKEDWIDGQLMQAWIEEASNKYHRRLSFNRPTQEQIRSFKPRIKIRHDKILPVEPPRQNTFELITRPPINTSFDATPKPWDFTADRRWWDATLGDVKEASDNIKLTEKHKKGASGEVLDVIELKGTVREGFPLATAIEQGSKIRVIGILNQATDELVSFEVAIFRDWKWQQRYRIDAIEKYADIPSEVGTFKSPPGTLLIRDTWWEKQADKVLSKVESKAGEIRVHSVEVNEFGDLYITMSQLYTKLPSGYEIERRPKIEATDDIGGQYVQRPDWARNIPYGGVIGARYWLEIFKHAQPDTGLAHKITLTMQPFKTSPPEDRYVVLKDIPLPARKKGEDLYEESKERIQY